MKGVYWFRKPGVERMPEHVWNLNVNHGYYDGDISGSKVFVTLNINRGAKGSLPVFQRKLFDALILIPRRLARMSKSGKFRLRFGLDSTTGDVYLLKPGHIVPGPNAGTVIATVNPTLL